MNYVLIFKCIGVLYKNGSVYIINFQAPISYYKCKKNSSYSFNHFFNVYIYKMNMTELERKKKCWKDRFYDTANKG